MDGHHWEDVTNLITGLLTNEVDPQVGTNRQNYVARWDQTNLIFGSIYDAGVDRVGIGTTNPAAMLHVAGDAKVNQTGTIGWLVVEQTADIDAWYHTNRVIKLNADLLDGHHWEDVTNLITGLLTNEVDPQVGTNRQNYVARWDRTNLVYGSIYDAGINRVGIGTAAPEATLHVSGNATVTGAVHAGKYHHVLDYSGATAPAVGYKIRTNLPFQNGSQMPTIFIEGYMYGDQKPMALELVYYIYNGAFVNCRVSSSGAYTPKVKLAQENDKVVIFLEGGSYYGQFHVSAFESKGTSNSWWEGWTVVDEALGGTAQVTVDYENRFAGNVFMPSNGIWNSLGKVGIGTTSPGAMLDVNGMSYLRGNVGVGVSPSSYKLDVNGGTAIRGALAVEGEAIFGGPVEVGNGVNGLFCKGQMRLTAGDCRIDAGFGNLLTLALYGERSLNSNERITTLVPATYGFAILNPSRQFQTLNSSEIGDLWVARHVISIAGQCTGSDERTKLEQSPLEYGVAEIMALVPKKYLHIEFRKNWETKKLEFDPTSGNEDIGLVAQEIVGVIPEAVQIPEDETEEIWTVDYSKITTVLVKAVQEQQQQLQSLSTQIQEQNAAIQALSTQIQTQASLLHDQQIAMEQLIRQNQ